jgi:hypothetical protein
MKDSAPRCPGPSRCDTGFRDMEEADEVMGALMHLYIGVNERPSTESSLGVGPERRRGAESVEWQVR